VLLDECHHCPAETFTAVVQAFPAVVRYGLSATPTRADGLTTFMTAVIGPYRSIITHRELERRACASCPTSGSSGPEPRSETSSKTGPRRCGRLRRTERETG
jgi:hypothetical protein